MIVEKLLYFLLYFHSYVEYYFKIKNKLIDNVVNQANQTSESVTSNFK